jgi:hypothetical protein
MAAEVADSTAEAADFMAAEEAMEVEGVTGNPDGEPIRSR